MPETTTVDAAARSAESTSSSTDPTGPPRRVRRPSMGLNRFSGLYVWAVIVVVFSLWVPQLFLTQTTWVSILGDQAITALLAFALLAPFAAGVFDLSVAGTLGASVCLCISLQSDGLSAPTAIALTLIFGAIVGAVNGAVVVWLKVDSFIATLAMGSILLAISYMVTGGVQIVGAVSPGFSSIAQGLSFGVPKTLFFVIAAAVVLWYVLQHTPVGRRLYAVGGNPAAARLSGVPVDRIIWSSLVASGTMAALTGILLASKLSTANPEIGPSYLLPAFSAVFLGATQIVPGKVNVLGTLIAIYLLATGVKGLQLAGAPNYVSDLFNGVALIAAVALAARAVRQRAR